MSQNGDFFKIYRKIFGSDIWLKPVELRLFLYLIGNARYSKEPNKKYKDKGVIIYRGQHLRSYRKLRDDLEYLENNSIKRYSLSKIKRAVDKLKEQKRIKTEITPLGTLFTVCNYEQYQGSCENKTGAWNADETELKRTWNGVGTEVKQYSKKVVRKEKEGCKKGEKNIKHIWCFYKELFEGIYKPRKFSNKRKGKIRQRLKTYSVEEIKKALENMRNNNYLCGDNDKGRVYAKPEYCFRNDEMIEDWLNVKDNTENNSRSNWEVYT